MLLVYKDFEWDLREAAANAAAHGVTFREASAVFADANVVVSEDTRSGRLRAVGRSSSDRVLTVLHQRGRRIRILGAVVYGAEKESAVPVSGEAAAADPAEITPAPTAPKEVVAARAAPKSLAASAEPQGGTPGHIGSKRPERAPSARRKATVVAAPVLVAVEPVVPAARTTRKPAKPTSDTPPPSGMRAAASWTADTYGIYWEAYSAARDEARREGKSTREAQRLGKEAGERAVNEAHEPPSPRAGRPYAPRSGGMRLVR